MTTLIDRFLAALKEKESILCVGLDPALPQQRSKNTIPSSYLQRSDENEARLDFCLDIIEQIKDYSIAAKPNQQYVLGFTKRQHQKLTGAIRKAGLLSILDYKLNDIGDTVRSSIYHLTECGYDAVTFNPLPGNMEEAIEFAHQHAKESRGYELGIIVLTLMSNPEAVKYMKEATLYNKPLYITIAEDVKKYGADGCVLGATGHVTGENIRKIRAIAGEEKIFLVPGVGAQKGSPEKIVRTAGRNILINVGRGIIYSTDPGKKAEEYCRKFEKIRKTYATARS